SVTASTNEDFVTHSVKPIANKTWVNLSGTIISPIAIFEPSTLEDLIDIVKLAKTNNKTIRCAAQGHTESSLSVTENYLVLVINLTQITIQEHPKYGWTVTAEAVYLPFTGFNQSDPNPLDPNRDLFRVASWVRTDESVNFTQQHINVLYEAQKQYAIRQAELLNSLLQNPEATPNITGALWKESISIINTTYVLQVPDSMHFSVDFKNVKRHYMALAFKVDPDFSNVVDELFYSIQA
ncbi:27450_t:CDS:2, partial [Racocetra persica]